MFCGKCGANLVTGAKFCQVCGTPVVSANAAPASSDHSSPGGVQVYTAPQQPVYSPPNAGSSKRKSKVWIPIAAGIAVLVLVFGALSLFTDIFPWSGNSREEQTTTSSRRRDEDDNGNATGTPATSQASPEGTVQPTSSIPEPDETDDLREKAITYLNALGCPIMDENDNRIGIRVRKIEKVDDGYKIYWDSDMGSGMAAFMFSLMRFFDPDDYSNNYQPFTISDGSLIYTFGDGDLIGYTEFRVRDFEPDCMMFHLYFEGALESMGATPDIQTDPLFFTFLLGDEPVLVEESPRYANGIFDNYIVPDVNPEEPSSIPEEYVGQWIGYAAGSYIEFDLQKDGSGVYTMTQGAYTENYSFTLELGTETFAVQIPSNNTSGIAAINGTYEYWEGMLILNISTTLNNGSVLPRSTVPCVKVSDNVGGDVVEQDIEIRTALYNMVVIYVGQWNGGAPNGAGVAIVMEKIPGRFEPGDTLAGMWVDGLLEGPGVYTAYDGRYSLRGTFINGLKEGTVQQYQDGVYIRDMEFVNGSPIN